MSEIKFWRAEIKGKGLSRNKLEIYATEPGFIGKMYGIRIIKTNKQELLYGIDGADGYEIFKPTGKTIAYRGIPFILSGLSELMGNELIKNEVIKDGFFSSRKHRATKDYVCSKCNCVIMKGEKYHRVFSSNKKYATEQMYHESCFVGIEKDYMPKWKPRTISKCNDCFVGLQYYIIPRSHYKIFESQIESLKHEERMLTGENCMYTIERFCYCPKCGVKTDW